MSDSVWFIAYPISIFAIISLIFHRVVKRRDQRLPEEKDFTPLYEEIAGGRFGTANYTFPFVRVSVYPRFLVVSAWNTYLLDYSVIKRVEIRRHVLCRGLHIHHAKPDLPPLIVWSWNCQRLKENIQEQMDLVA